MTTTRIKIHKHCVPNVDDRCESCRGRRISEKKKRVCPLYSALMKKDPVKLYEYFATETAELRAKVEELQDIIQRFVKGSLPN